MTFGGILEFLVFLLFNLFYIFFLSFSLTLSLKPVMDTPNWDEKMEEMKLQFAEEMRKMKKQLDEQMSLVASSFLKSIPKKPLSLSSHPTSKSTPTPLPSTPKFVNPLLSKSSLKTPSTSNDAIINKETTNVTNTGNVVFDNANDANVDSLGSGDGVISDWSSFDFSVGG